LVVSIAVMALLGLCRWASEQWAWWLGPLVLIAGAVLPTLARRRALAGLGLRLGRVGQGIVPLCAGGACMLVLGLIGVTLFKHLSMQPPLVASVPKERWPWWVLFQFVYVAFPEELFFRGYFLSNSLSLLRTAGRMGDSAAGVMSVVLSAGVFALSHVVVLGNPAAVLTFFPGLIFGWLFVKVGSLAPSIVLHGAANIGYAMMAGVVT
jgi:membrane protease YdiL (CAAX protease family)